MDYTILVEKLAAVRNIYSFVTELFRWILNQCHPLVENMQILSAIK